MHVYEVSAFTRNDKGGNLAGVIILEDQIDDNLKQEMAAKLNYSETVFVEDIGDNHFNISFFTPNQEVNLCGHGTIACFWLLNKLGLITQEVAFQHTKQGILKVIVKDNILMEMSSPKRLNNVSKDITALLLNINTNEIINIPQVIEVGLADCMVIVKDLATLNKIVINKDAMIKYCNENDFIGFHVLTLDNNKYYVRNFGPSCGIDEESATGTANGGMYEYLESKGYIKGDEEIFFYQGDNMNLVSRIDVKKIDNVIYVGGKASLNKEFDI